MADQRFPEFGDGGGEFVTQFFEPTGFGVIGFGFDFFRDGDQGRGLNHATV